MDSTKTAAAQRRAAENSETIKLFIMGNDNGKLSSCRKNFIEVYGLEWKLIIDMLKRSISDECRGN